MIILYIAVALLALLFMITIHELGHYLAAKALKIKVHEFAIGFGKAIFKRTSKKTGEIFSIRLIPLGGYCAFAGDTADSMDGKTEQNEKLADGSVNEKAYIPYDKQPPWKRLITLFAGGFANFICAIVFLWVLLMVLGYYNTVEVRSFDVAHNDLRTGDVIVEIDGRPLTFLNNFNVLTSEMATGADNGVYFTVIRAGQTTSEQVFIYRDRIVQGGRDYVGIGLRESTVHWQSMGVFEAIPQAFVFSGELAWFMLRIFFELITGQRSINDVGGPITTISFMSEAVGASLMNLLILIPLISINLAVFNLLPIPALDGARMVFVTIEWIRRKPINPVIENRIHGIGLLILFGLVIILDLNNIFFSSVTMYNVMLC